MVTNVLAIADPAEETAVADDMREEVRKWIALAPASSVNNPHAIRRNCPRREWPIPFEVVIRNDSGRQMRIVATIRDLSEHGAMLFCRVAQGRYDTLLLRPDPTKGRFQWVRARVAHCTQSIGTYKLGVEFLELHAR